MGQVQTKREYIYQVKVKAMSGADESKPRDRLSGQVRLYGAMPQRLITLYLNLRRVLVGIS